MPVKNVISSPWVIPKKTLGLSAELQRRSTPSSSSGENLIFGVSEVNPTISTTDSDTHCVSNPFLEHSGGCTGGTKNQQN